MSNWTAVYSDLIDDCLEHKDRLNDWEREFVEVLDFKISRGIQFSQKQIEKLETVHEKVMKNG